MRCLSHHSCVYFLRGGIRCANRLAWRCDDDAITSHHRITQRFRCLCQIPALVFAPRSSTGAVFFFCPVGNVGLALPRFTGFLVTRCRLFGGDRPAQTHHDKFIGNEFGQLKVTRRVVNKDVHHQNAFCHPYLRQIHHRGRAYDKSAG